jgi:hypothetical protein
LSQDFSKSVKPISIRGEGGHDIPTIPTLGCSDLPTALVCALLGQAKLFDSIHNCFIGLIMKEKLRKYSLSSHKNTEKKVTSYLFFITFKFTAL